MDDKTSGGGKRKIPAVISRIQYNSPVILTFTLVAFIATMLNYLTAGWSNAILFTVYRSSMLNPLFYLRLVTYIFGHSDLQHYLSNFMLILLAGPMLEEKYGGKKLMVMMGVTAVLTGIINIIFFPTGLIGASGIAFMLILLSSFVNIEQGKIPMTLILVAVYYLSGEIYAGIFSRDNISQMAHILGGVCGGGFGWFFSKNKK